MSYQGGIKSKSKNRYRYHTLQSQQNYNRRYSEQFNIKSVKHSTETSAGKLNRSSTNDADNRYIEQLHKIKNQRIKEIYNPKLRKIKPKKYTQLPPTLNHKPYLQKQSEKNLTPIHQETKKKEKAMYRTSKILQNNIKVNKQLPKFTSFYDNYSSQKLITKQKSPQIPNNYQPHLTIIKQSNFSSFVMKKHVEGVYYGQFNQQKNIREGKGIIFYKNGKLFEGQFENNLKSGYGYELYPGGSFYLGEFKNGNKNGKGKFQWSNGQLYDGQWENNLQHGSGLWQGEGSSYIGQWNHGVISGFGILTNSKGQRYQGQFNNFCKQGKGTYKFENGQMYTGMFYKNKPNGEGEYYWQNGDHYKGDFVNGLRHGCGLMKYVNGTQYSGQYRNDKKCGLGQQIFEDGIVYVGNYENDLRHGYGKLLCEEELFYDGYWLNNKALDINQGDIIEEDDKELLGSVDSPEKEQVQDKRKQRAHKVIRNEIKYKKRKVQKSSSNNVLERLYNPHRRECKCGLKH